MINYLESENDFIFKPQKFILRTNIVFPLLQLYKN